jgi:hypothetical protein
MSLNRDCICGRLVTRIAPPTGNPWNFYYDGQLNRYWRVGVVSEEPSEGGVTCRSGATGLGRMRPVLWLRSRGRSGKRTLRPRRGQAAKQKAFAAGGLGRS